VIDRCQRVVDLVSESRGQGADGGQPLGAAEDLFLPPPFADIAHQHIVASNLAVAVDIGNPLDMDLPGAAVRPAERGVGTHSLAAECLLDIRTKRLEGIAEDILHQPAAEVPALGPEPLLITGIVELVTL